MSMSDLMFNTDLLKEALTTGSFWTYPGIGIAIMLIIGFINRKANFSDKDKTLVYIKSNISISMQY